METKKIPQIKWKFKSSRILNPESAYFYNKFAKYNQLIDDATKHLELTQGGDLRTISSYRINWKQARAIMAENHITEFNEETVSKILNARYGDKHIGLLTSSEFRFRRSILKLIEYLKTSKITLNHYPKRKKFDFDGPIGVKILDFFDYMISEQGISKNTLRTYEQKLSLFYKYCNSRKINSIEEIDQTLIVGFLTDASQKPSIRADISNLRCFMRYLFDHGYSKNDLSKKIPIFKNTNLSKLPSVYSKEDIEKLILSIDRSSAIGKRNFAMILLAARLGLRAMDIARMKFENIDWTNDIINLIQSKTHSALTLPLLPEVGNAIINYLKFGRPNSDTPFLFLRQVPPYSHFENSNVVTQVVQRAFLNAGISVKNKRFGPHSLRHSLGFRLLQKSTAISVISEILGHKNSDTTKQYYLRIDLKSMEPCALSVTEISNDFYEQLGGIFYDKET